VTEQLVYFASDLGQNQDVRVTVKNRVKLTVFDAFSDGVDVPSRHSRFFSQHWITSAKVFGYTRNSDSLPGWNFVHLSLQGCPSG